MLLEIAEKEYPAMRIFLMLTRAAISAGALLFWIWLNAMASTWNTSSGGTISIRWLTDEALIFFWLPFSVGVVIAFAGWKRQ